MVQVAPVCVFMLLVGGWAVCSGWPRGTWNIVGLRNLWQSCWAAGSHAGLHLVVFKLVLGVLLVSA